MTVSATEGNLIYNAWTLVESSFDPVNQHTRETVFTIGNGYVGTRGTFEEGYPESSATTLMHGVFDDVPILYTELANCPDWLAFSIVVAGGDRFRLDQGDILFYQRVLNLKDGVLSRVIHWRSPSGYTFDIQFERFTSLDNPHLLAVQLKVKSLDYEGPIEIQSSLSGYPDNQGYNHWDLINQSAAENEIGLSARTRGTMIELGVVAQVNAENLETQPMASNVPGYPTLSYQYQAKVGQEICLQKKVAIFSSRDTSDPLGQAQAMIQTSGSYTVEKQNHQQAWQAVWDRSDVVVEGDVKAQNAIRYNLFQLIICGPQADDRVSIAAKTLSGFGYRGHVFWDTEIFILPFFNFTQPDIVRNLLTYRYHTLDGARRKAQHYGYKGAMYAWESAVTGDEVTPRWAALTQPYANDIRIWCRDLEVHISSDIAYAIWNYWQSTGDEIWVRDYGAEIILDTAVFWMSRAELNPKTGFFEIRNVIGADEFHEHVDNNTFTNRLVQWHLEKALFIFSWLSEKYPEKAYELEQKLDLSEQVRARWQDIAKNMLILFDEETRLIEQYEGFFKLEDINLQDYEPRQKSMQTILGIDGANARQVLKQPDVLMLLYLMRELEEFPYDLQTLQANWDYYLPRTDTTYGSSLGPAIHAILASDLGLNQEAYEHFWQAALVDLEDLRGNAHEGIHGASAGGVWQMVVFGFGGINLTPSGPVATPQLPPSWNRLRFKLHWKNQWHCFDILRKSQQPESSETLSEQYSIDHTVNYLDAMEHHRSNTSGLDIQAAIFDLDGVITDTAEYHYLAWKQLADEEGLEFNRDVNESLRGIPRRDSLLKILGDQQVSEDQLQAMMARKNECYIEFIQRMTPDDLLPGSLEFLVEAKRANLKIALGSASKNARTVLNKLEITDYFDFIADGHSVKRSKPAPDLFLFAAQNLGISPQQTLVFEDAAAGISAAHAAQMWTVGLGPRERVGAAHAVYQSLENLHWQDVAEQLSQLSNSFAVMSSSIPNPVEHRGAIA